jgi:hypothetical protein
MKRQQHANSNIMSINFNNEESKAVIREKIANNFNNLTSLVKQILKSSKSTDLLQTSLKSFASAEANIDNTGDKLNKINILTTQLKFQSEEIESNCKLIKDICEQIHSIKQQEQHQQ